MNGTAVVVGGGIGELTRAGWQVTVLSGAAAFTEVGARIVLEPNAVKSLNWLGLQGKLRALAMAQGTAGLRTWRGRWPVRSRVEVLRERYGVPAYGLHRADLLQLLVDAASDADLRTGQRVTGMVQHDWSGEFANQRIAELREADRRRLVSRIPDRTTGRHRDRPPGSLRLAGRHGQAARSRASNQEGSHADTASPRAGAV